MRELLHIGAYNSFVQSTLVQAQVCYCDQLNMISTTTSQNHVFKARASALSCDCIHFSVPNGWCGLCGYITTYT